MALFKTTSVATAESQVAVARRRITTFEAERAKLAARDDDGLDFDARFTLGEDLALCDRKLAAARADVEKVERTLAEARNAEAEAEGDQRHKEGEKVAKAGVRLAENVEAAIGQLAAAIAASESNREQIAAINAQRGARPLILDGEERLRSTPHRTEPAVFEERDVWTDGAGRKPSVLRQLPSGELVPAEGGYVKARERVQVRAEQFIPGGMPSRYADAIVLVNRKGERIKPTAK